MRCNWYPPGGGKLKIEKMVLTLCVFNIGITSIITSTSVSDSADDAWIVNSSGNVNGYLAYGASGVAPVLSMTSELDIGLGTGTSIDHIS